MTVQARFFAGGSNKELDTGQDTEQAGKLSWRGAGSRRYNKQEKLHDSHRVGQAGPEVSQRVGQRVGPGVPQEVGLGVVPGDQQIGDNSQ